MKYVWMLIRLILPAAAIVLLGLSMAGKAGDPNWLLAGGLLCSTAGLWLNIWFQRRERRNRP